MGWPDRRSSSEIVEAAQAALGRWRGWSRLAAVLEERPAMDLYLAGGALRSLVLGEGSPPIKDLDFFLDERDQEAVLSAIDHDGRIEYTVFGLPRWYPAGAEDMYCDLVTIQRFYCGLDRCRTMLDVLRQFDFTANAMALDLRQGRLLDPLDGSIDLRHGVMRAVRLDYPDEPVVPGHDLTRNQVLWFRFVHYTAKLGLEIEPVTLAWLREYAPALRKRERYEEVFQRLHPRINEVLERHGLG